MLLATITKLVARRHTISERAGSTHMFVLIVISVVTVLDQLSKTLISLHLDHHTSIPVVRGFFNLAHVHNTGAAFSMFHDSNEPLALFSAAILLGLICFHKRILNCTLPHRFAIAMMTAGIIGNLLDRIRFASVVDFLDFYWKNNHFPTFNIADSSICIGVAVYVLFSIFDRRNGMGARDRSGGGEGSGSLQPESTPRQLL